MTGGALLLLAALGAADVCPPAGYTVEQLSQLKFIDFAVPADEVRQALALALTGCLGDPRPAIRDGIAFEALSKWMRGAQLDQATLRALRDILVPGLDVKDAAGFRAPFSALVMSEVARTDRVKPWMTADEREALVQAATRYLPAVKDYRGFSDTEGWRHGVAHGADLVLQLALNPGINKPQLDRLLEAVASQVSPAAAPAYHNAEPERLAQPVFYIAQRGMHDETEWDAWFARVLNPAPLASWDDAFSSEAGLSKRHNTLEFILVLHAAASDSANPNVARMLPALREALKRVQ
ncbi:MAG: DUF2785 domain-containing protein [Vicinamibacterales bacterium]